MSTRHLIVGALLANAILPAVAATPDLEYAAMTGLGRSDNVLRTHSTKHSESLAQIGLELAAPECRSENRPVVL
jgi:hypothetical protein